MRLDPGLHARDERACFESNQRSFGWCLRSMRVTVNPSVMFEHRETVPFGFGRKLSRLNEHRRGCRQLFFLNDVDNREKVGLVSTKRNTTLSGGSLGSWIDEERS